MPRTVSDRSPSLAATIWSVAAVLLLGSGLVHVAVWLGTGAADLAGPVSWRKPILFGFSAGATAASFAWIVGRCRAWRWEVVASSVAAVALVVEVALITMQTWRGVPSHFNHATPFDHAVHLGMDALITVVTLYTLLLAGRVLRSFDAQPETTLAVRAGLGLLVVSCVVGYAFLFVGLQRAEAGLDPSKYGEAGVPKFAHGVVIHALQLLPLLAWWLQTAGLDAATRWQRVVVATTGQGLLLGFALIQTLAGRGRLDLTPTTGLLAVVAVGAVVYSALPFPVRWRGWSTRSTAR